MKYTNKHNAPEALMNYVNNEEKAHDPLENTFSVTELLDPVQEIVLKRHFHDKLEMDISDKFTALLGTGIHKVLELNKDNESEVEFPMEMKFFDKYTLKGRCDVLNRSKKLIEDYKTCTTSKIQKMDFAEWRLQGLMYAYILYFNYHIEIRNLKFYGFMKDWSKIKASKNPSYPQNPIYTWTYTISDSDFDEIQDFIYGKLKLIDENINNYPVALMGCTEDDRWYSGDEYAVFKKPGDKRATKVFDSEQAAKEFITNECGGVGEIQMRKGESVKCKYYCICKDFCKQYKEENNEN